MLIGYNSIKPYVQYVRLYHDYDVYPFHLDIIAHFHLNKMPASTIVQHANVENKRLEKRDTLWVWEYNKNWAEHHPTGLL